ncbi:MAG: WD40 repeat domain-containing serine/threonine-protein kinase [Cyanobacteria bacterium J06581_3]
MSAYCPNPTCPRPQNPDAAKFCDACGTDLLLADRYRLVALLGEGGFGRTFLAENWAEGELRCVVKQVFAGQVSAGRVSSKAIAANTAFEDEAERLRQLGKHPQIPRLLDAIETESGQYLVQEFAPGQNLQQQVEEKGPWDEAGVRSLLKSLVAVLQYVHSFQVIHRDIKPANIAASANLLGSDVAGRLKKSPPMLVDFGSAKWVRQAPAKTVIGSAGYAAPEQSMGQATFASDVYSLGLTCLYLLTGVHPFQLYSAVEDRWVWRDYLSAPLDARFVEVLDGMVARSLQQRYASMDEVELALKGSQNLLAGSPQEMPQRLLERAKASVPGLKSLLQKGSDRASVGSKQNALQNALASGQRGAIAGDRQPASQQWERRYRLAPNIGLTNDLAMSPNGREFASGSNDGSIHLWQVTDARLVHTFPRKRLVGKGHSGAISALAFHPDGRVLYSASADGTIKEWDLITRQLLNTLPVQGWTLTDLAITPDGSQLMGASRDGKIVVWEIASLLPVTQLTQHQQCVNAIAFATIKSRTARNASILVSASDDGTLKLWQPSAEPGKPSFQLTRTANLRQVTLAQQGGKRLTLKDGGAIALAVSPDQSALSDRHVAVATSTGAVLLYSIDRYLDISGPLLLTQSSQQITSLAMSKAQYLAIGTDDRVLTLWSVETAECVAQLKHDWGVGAIVFTPDGRSLITASADEVISIWRRSG